MRHIDAWRIFHLLSLWPSHSKWAKGEPAYERDNSNQLLGGGICNQNKLCQRTEWYIFKSQRQWPGGGSWLPLGWLSMQFGGYYKVLQLFFTFWLYSWNWQLKMAKYDFLLLFLQWPRSGWPRSIRSSSLGLTPQFWARRKTGWPWSKQVPFKTRDFSPLMPLLLLKKYTVGVLCIKGGHYS